MIGKQEAEMGPDEYVFPPDAAGLWESRSQAIRLRNEQTAINRSCPGCGTDVFGTGGASHA